MSAMLKSWAELIGLQGLTTRIASPGSSSFVGRVEGGLFGNLPNPFILLGVPKRKTSVMRRKLRRDGQRRRKNDQYVNYRMCPKCDVPVAPHFLCPKCQQIHGRF
eukprot:TRINITY_DN982_c0_g1_i1.p1 TRINITY_DN982_c0_g1~~TRINITY_DN982_c0_g1_i1.p1  ORF type:complete len:119 (-),score=26.80 TRINITY_DN982_c0_g1_i1:79-393(-)